MVNFKRIEMYGFKAFADATVINFQSGITGIVGPNGCGKSNVVDSVRWVLGEQSAKLLRGKNMTDVIFVGTDRRKPMSYCEVNLYFDNTNHYFSHDSDEIVISRKLYRTGESEYSLNRLPCKLKDIVELLRDTGIGRDGYSIIGQDKSKEILSSKPEARRKIFEEAAGISKFKSRKIEAERKLCKANENLEILNGRIHEVELVLKPLEKAAANQIKYDELVKELKYYEVNSYIYHCDNANNRKDAIRKRILAIEKNESDIKTGISIAVRNYDMAMDNIYSLDRSINALREERTKQLVEQSDLKGKNNVIIEKLNYNRNQKNALLAELSSISDKRAIKLSELQSNKQTREETALIIENTKTSLINIEAKLSIIMSEIAKAEEQINSGNEELRSLSQKLTNLRVDMSSLTTELNALNPRKAELTVTVEDAKTAIEQYLKLREETENNVNVAHEEINKLIKARNTMISQYNELQKKYNEDVAKLREYNVKIGSLSASVKFYSDRDAMGGALKRLIDASKRDENLRSNIEVLVAEMIKVKPEYEVAIETALGGALQNVVTRDEQAARYIIEYLKKYSIGKLTFLPMTSYKSRPLEPEYRAVVRERGCIGIASELVDYNIKYRSIVEGLLGRTVIIDNIDNAIVIARKYRYSFKLVTLDGDVFNTAGSISGGSSRSDRAGLLSQERLLAKAKKDLEDAENEYKELLEDVDQYAKEASGYSNDISKLRDNINAKELVLERERVRLDAIASDITKLKESYDKNSKELNGINKRITEINALIIANNELNKQLLDTNSTSDSMVVKVQAEHNERYKARDELIADKYAKEAVVTSANEKLNHIDGEIARITEDLEELTNNEASANANIKTCDVNIDNLEYEIESLRSGIASNERTVELDKSIAECVDKKEKLQNDLEKYNCERTELNEKLLSLQQSRSDETTKLALIDSDLEKMGEKIAEDYGLNYMTCLDYKDALFDIAASKSIIDDLRKQKNALGPINPTASEEYENVKERFSEMDAQRNDIVEAKEELEGIIYDLTKEMTEKFNTEFEKINANFKEVIAELFNGGKGKLEILPNEEDPLEAGIEIYSQPAGKKLQSISLLSGGEQAMTAIAILFAILKLRPMPFCILDEIDAPLDDANAGVFAQYLKKYSESTQFIVITHRKPTMEKAENLFGVTMQEKGVSSIISVQLAEAAKYLEE